LLLLRVVCGLVVLVQGGFYIATPASPGTWLMSLSAFAAGCLLLIGFLTPIVALLVAAGAAGVALSLLPACAPTLFESKISLIFALTILVAIAGLGPGAFSLDARLFGRREIIIPPRTARLQE